MILVSNRAVVLLAMAQIISPALGRLGHRDMDDPSPSSTVGSGIDSDSDPQQSSPNVTGNCVSGVYRFNSSRVYTMGWDELPNPYPPLLPYIDPLEYDFTIDYGSSNVVFYPNKTVGIQITKADESNMGYGARLSSTRYILYGRITMRMKAIPAKGIITSFISLSDQGDEIDWEIVNTHPEAPATSNIFYSRIPEYGKRDKNLTPPNNTNIDVWHEYTIDWNRQRILWMIDDKPLRQYNFNESLQNGTFFYPVTPSIVQIAVWDGGDVEQNGTAKWAGGPVQWGNNSYFEAQFGPLRVVCYDDNDFPAKSWPSLNATAVTSTVSPTSTN
ncbi:hypothetical protein HDU97_010209 [Phlyctochytrium planicorne]|nr:hypothetical protein HDU97_010209 [Phlyctochytrium planicorne]